MTIALHAHDLDPRRCTGISRYANGLAGALGTRGDEPVVMITSPDCGVVTSSAVQHVLTPRSRRVTYAGWLTVRRPRIEGIVADASLVHVTAPILPVPTAKPLVVTVHDVMPLTNPEWFSARARRLFGWCVPWLQHRVDAVVVPTEFVARQVVAILGIAAAKVHVSGEGVDVAWLGAASTADESALRAYGLSAGSYFLHLGAVSARKNMATVLQAHRSDLPDIVLAGPTVEGQVQGELGDARGVRLLGGVPDAHVGPLLRGAVALVHPSRFEGFGLTVLEAMAVGTPVVCSDAGALPEVVGDAAIVVPADDVTAWSAAMLQVQESGVRDDLVTRGLRRASEWTWPTAAERTRAVYESVRR